MRKIARAMQHEAPARKLTVNGKQCMPSSLLAHAGRKLRCAARACTPRPSRLAFEAGEAPPLPQSHRACPSAASTIEGRAPKAAPLSHQRKEMHKIKWWKQEEDL